MWSLAAGVGSVDLAPKPCAPHLRAREHANLSLSRIELKAARKPSLSSCPTIGWTLPVTHLEPGRSVLQTSYLIPTIFSAFPTQFKHPRIASSFDVEKRCRAHALALLDLRSYPLKVHRYASNRLAPFALRSRILPSQL